MSKKHDDRRRRCTVVGCNPRLFGKQKADRHVRDTGHRIAMWPVRSKFGQYKQEMRYRSRLIELYGDAASDEYPASGESLGQDGYHQ